jgi:hypothetical protein
LRKQKGWLEPPLPISAKWIAKKQPSPVGLGCMMTPKLSSRLLSLYLLLFGCYILLALAQKLKELFPRSEPEGESTIDFLHPARELLMALLPVRSNAD